MPEIIPPFNPRRVSSFFVKSTGGFQIQRKNFRRLLTTYGISALILGVLIFYGLRVLFLRDFAAQSKSQIYAQLEEARLALRDLDPAGARNPLALIDEEIRLVQSEAGKYGVLTLSRLWSSLSDTLEAIPSTLQNLAGISGTAIHLNDDIAFLKDNAASLMMDGRGEELLDRLEALQSKLQTLTSYVGELDARGGLDESTMKAIAGLQSEIDRNNRALTSLLPILKTETPKHFLVLFQNPTEMRPGGGFIGSYGHIAIARGSVLDIEIRDIYDPDGQLNQRVIPPEPLQMITKDWEARDANWFFDYPTSARKVISFLNASKIYQERGTTFEGAIAINTNVLRDIVTLLGPMEIPEYSLTITPENFLSELQREVESGPDKKINQPKRILKVFAPMILKELTTLDNQEKRQFADVIARHLRERNVMLYFADSELERYVRGRGIAGDVFPANPAAVSEYLAVVNSNIGGAKSDAYVSQKIDFKALITEAGEIRNTLTVERVHAGNKRPEWWYRSTNRNYLQVFTALGSRLMGVSGRSMWPKTPLRNYQSYATDPDLAGVESTRRYLDDFGIDRTVQHEKTVFGAWVTTPAGGKSTYVLQYKNPRTLNPESGIPYEFVFEKQSGASTTLAIHITAPPRYKWKEINKGVIEYETAEPVGRIRIRQTLIPIE